MSHLKTRAIVAAIIFACAPHKSASAADLPARSAAPAPYRAIPVFTWTGFYVGVNAGGAFGGRGGEFSDPTYGSVTGSGGGDTAFAGGAQVGFNYQFTPGSGFVIGAEADIQGLTGGSRGSYAIGTVPFYSIAPSLDYVGTVRGRVGYAFDRLLVYGTGGFAYGGGSLPTVPSSFPYSVPDTTRTGFAAGGGVEYAFTSNITAKLEGLYIRLNEKAVTTFYDATTAAYYGAAKRDDGFGLIRAGINYKF